MSQDPKGPVDRVEALAAEVDTAFAAIQERHGARMQCRAGCSACCRARLSITKVEEELVRRGLAGLTKSRRAELVARTKQAGREMCPALDDDGRCGIYSFRPLICRSYGVPLRHRSAVPMVQPPVVDVCDLNFTETSLKMLPDEDTLDQTAMNEELESIDREYCKENGLPERGRVPIASILE